MSQARFSSVDAHPGPVSVREWRASEWRIGELNWAGKPALGDESARRAHHVTSQAIYTEEAGLLAACRLARIFEDRNVRRFMSRQASDESKHSEVFDRYVACRFGGPLPRAIATEGLLAGLEAIDDPGRLLLAHTLLEGLALDEFSFLKQDFSGDLLADIFLVVRTDEARHVSAGMGLSRRVVAGSRPSEIEELWHWCCTSVPGIAGLPLACDAAPPNQPASREAGMVTLLTRRFHSRCRQIFRSFTGANRP